jgi:IS30 family transposase
MCYTHLNLEERHYIECELKKGISQNKIAEILQRNQSSISREIRRNRTQQGYRYQVAHRECQQRHKEKTKYIKLTPVLKQRIEQDLEQQWSPEQIAGRLKQEGLTPLHHETIYRYVVVNKKEGGDLYTHLRHQKKRYRKRYGHANNRTGIPNRVDISERPECVNQRERVGDWEADTMIGKNHKGALLTLDERKSKLRLAFPLSGKKAQPVVEAAITLLQGIKSVVKTITFDNGKEFSFHEKIAKALNCKTYFATPYHSWERGQNENANGLLRQYFPKGEELKDIPLKKVLHAVDRLNSRPRKCLGFKTPYEVFEELTGIDMKRVM